MGGSRKQFFELGVSFVLLVAFLCPPAASQINCAVPQNVTRLGSTPSATTLTLNWALPATFPASCALQLVVCWSSNEAHSSTCQTLPPTTTSVAIAGLQPCTPYNVRVTVKPLTGTSVTATFNEHTSVGGATNVSVAWVSAISLRVSWQHDADRRSCLSRFLAVVCNTSNQEITTCLRMPVPPAATNNSNYSVDVLNLPTCRVYHVRVVTEGTLQALPSVTSVELPFTLDGVSVTTYNVTDVGFTSMRVQWSVNQPADISCAHSLTACALPVGDGRVRCAANVTSPTTAVNITNLRPCTAYQLRLNLSTLGGESVTLGPMQATYSTDFRLVSSLQVSRSRDQILARWVPAHVDPPCSKGYRICWNDTVGRVCEDTNTTTTSFTILELESGSYVVEVAGIFFNDVLSPSVSQIARISGAATIVISPIVLVIAITCGKAVQMA